MEYHDGIIGDESPPVPDETAPAAPVVEEPPVVAEPATPDAPVESAPTHPDEPEAAPDAVQKRINRVIWEREEAKREAAYYRGKAEAAEQQRQQGAGPQQPSQPQSEPRPEDYETQDAYDAARIDYRVEQKLAAQRTADAMEAQHQAEQATMAESIATWRAREAEVTAQFPDYAERISTVGAQITEQVRWGLQQLGADVPDMILHLHAHPEAIQQLNQTPAHRLGIEFGRLLRQTASPNGSASPPARAAPPPIPKPEPPTQLPGGGHTSSPDTYREGMSAAEYRTMRQRTSTLPYIRTP